MYIVLTDKCQLQLEKCLHPNKKNKGGKEKLKMFILQINNITYMKSVINKSFRP